MGKNLDETFTELLNVPGKRKRKDNFRYWFPVTISIITLIVTVVLLILALRQDKVMRGLPEKSKHEILVSDSTNSNKDRNDSSNQN
jgi:hypothetical protein